MTRSVIACLILVASAKSAFAIDPIGKDPAPQSRHRPTTWHDYRDEMIALNRSTLSGAYQKLGKHGAWDADAVKFLDEMAVAFACGKLKWVYLPKDLKTRPEMLPVGKAALDAGCRDPLVLYCYGAIVQEMGRDAEGLALVREAVDRLEREGYPSIRVAGAAARLERMDPSPATHAKLAPTILKHRLNLCCGKLSDIERRLAVDYIWSDLSTQSRDEQANFVDALRARADADPWVLDVLDGRLEVERAWDDRGSDVAPNVTEAGWKGFYEHLTKARDSLVAAYKLAPHLPESSRHMITVAMGGGQRFGEDPKTWFDRAIAAQMDDQDAYGRMLNALLPRWGGDYGQMYELGVHAVQTDRYDTMAPAQYYRAVESIALDSGSNWPALLARPGVYDGMAEVADKYGAAKAKTRWSDQWAVSFRAALAWHAGKYAESRRFFDRAGDHVEPTAFAELGIQNASTVMGQVYLLTDPHAADATKAEADFKAGRYDQAIKAFQAIAAAPDTHPRAKHYLDARIHASASLAAFARGEWADVQPDKDLNDWVKRGGIWRLADDGSVHGEVGPDKLSPALIYTHALGQRVEFAGTIGVDPNRHGTPSLAVVSSADGPGLFLYVSKTDIGFVAPGIDERIPTDKLADLGSSAPFVMTCDNGKLSLSINEKLVLDKHPMPPGLIRDVYVGVGSSRYHGEAVFSGLKVRRMPGDPKPAGKSGNDGFD